MATQCLAYLAASVDGFIAGPGGDIEWLHRPAYTGEINGLQFGDFVSGVDALVMGRRTFEKVLGFDRWPYGDLPIVVLTNRPIDIPAALRKIVSVDRGEPREIIVRLEQAGRTRLYIDGGNTLQGFLRARLINELTITWIPILLGDGVSLFGRLGSEFSLELIASTTSGNGFVQSRYRVLPVR